MAGDATMDTALAAHCSLNDYSGTQERYRHVLARIFADLFQHATRRRVEGSTTWRRLFFIARCDYR